MDEARLLEKLQRIEALFAGATTPGERDAAAHARERIQARLGASQQTNAVVEVRFSLGNWWSRSLFSALARRYGLEPYRYRQQRHTTLQIRADKKFINEVLWPQFLELDKTLTGYLEEVTDRVIKKAVHADVSDASVKDEPKSLGAASQPAC